MDNIQAAYQAGIRALQQGDAQSARPQLALVYRSDPTNQDVALAYAMALRDTLAREECAKVIDQLLEANPRHFMGLMVKADNLVAMGKRGVAGPYYQAAASLVPNPEQHPPHIQKHVERARQNAAQLVTEYEAYAERFLKDEGFAQEPGEPLNDYQHAVDILFGKRQIYMQQPIQFYFPGLPQKQFYNREDFPWAADIEAHTSSIAKEAQALVGDKAAYPPYLGSDYQGPRTGQNALDGSADWGACYLIKDGKEVDENASRCPQAMAALRQLSEHVANQDYRIALFSLLRPDTHIEPHHGFTNARLICHLPLVVPPNCALRVGNDTREWDVGKLTIFDDSMEHEAYNKSDQIRIVLLFDIWRPELSERDRTFVNSMNNAIKKFK